jgi:hypothetical protein
MSVSAATFAQFELSGRDPARRTADAPPVYRQISPVWQQFRRTHHVVAGDNVVAARALHVI